MRRDVIIAADRLHGRRVVEAQGSHVGFIEDVAIDVRRGAITHVVVSRRGAAALTIPWGALALDEARGCFVLREKVPA